MVDVTFEQRLLYRISELLKERNKLINLLEEWLDTPFFETKEDWEKWVKDYRPRVEKELSGGNE